MDNPWQFSIVNACFTMTVVWLTHLGLLFKLRAEFSDQIARLMTAPVVETQISSRLMHIEDMMGEMKARLDRSEDRMEAFLGRRDGP